MLKTKIKNWLKAKKTLFLVSFLFFAYGTTYFLGYPAVLKELHRIIYGQQRLYHVVKEVKATYGPETGTKAWAMQKWANRFGEKVAWQLEVIMDTKESGWDANAYHCNTNGTVDLSWYQINSVHVDSGKLSLKCAADPICSTEFAIKLYDEQGWCPWYGAKKLGFCK